MRRELTVPQICDSSQLTWYSSRRPTTTPTRTFTVPDDCSTDDNEPLDETIDELTAIAPGINAAMVTVDDEARVMAGTRDSLAGFYQQQAEDILRPCNSTTDVSHQLDGAADEISTSDDAPPRLAHLHVGEDQPLCSASSRDASHTCKDKDAGPPGPTDSLTDTDDEDEGQDIESLYDIDTDIDLDTHNVNHGDMSRSPSWNSFSSDSEDQLMGDESGLDSSGLEGSAVFEEDSDDFEDEADMDGVHQPDADLDSEQQPIHGLRAFTMEVGPSLQRLPPISSVIPAGANDWMSRSHSERGPRSPSPSDAVLLPRHYRLDAAGGKKTEDVGLNTLDWTIPKEKSVVDKFQVTAENSGQKPEEVNSTASGNDIPYSTGITEVGPSEANRRHGNDEVEMENDLEPIAQQNGKAEYFAARAVNKKVLDENTRIECASEAASPKLDHSYIHSSDECEAEMREVSNKTPEAAVQSSGFILAPHTRGLTGEGTFMPMSHHPDPVDAQSRSPYGSWAPYDLKPSLWATFDPNSHEPSSAYELHCLKQQIPAGYKSWVQYMTAPAHCEDAVFPVEARTNMGGPVSTDLGLSVAVSHTFEQLERETPVLDKQGASVQPTDKHDVRKGKRKAAEISEETLQEIEWAHSISQDESKAASSSEAMQSSSSHSTYPSSSDQIPLPSPPPSLRESASPEQRPTKKIKKIAERVGYAALGGVSVGAMVLTSLIYTAPSFV